MKIWHTTVSAVVFTTLLVYGTAWPYDESESVTQAQILNSDYPVESQDNMMVAQNPEDSGEKYNTTTG